MGEAASLRSEKVSNLRLHRWAQRFLAPNFINAIYCATHMGQVAVILMRNQNAIVT